MDDSEVIMHQLFILMKGRSRGYVANENAKKLCITYAKLLCHIDSAFSCFVQERQEILLLPP